MNVKDLARVDRQFKRVAKQYENVDDQSDLLSAIKYMIYDFLYRPSDETDTDCSSKTITNRVHWMHLKRRYSNFVKTCEDISDKIFHKIMKLIEERVDGDKSHPSARLIYYLRHFKELHIRKPKQGLTEDTRDVINGRVYKFHNSLAKLPNLAMLIFTPLPSDQDENIFDPAEMNEEDHLLFAYHKMTGDLNTKYKVSDQFCLMVTKEWGEFARLLHNIFHLTDYMNMDILFHIYTEYNKKWRTVCDNYKKLEKEEAWKQLKIAYTKSKKINLFQKLHQKYGTEAWPDVFESVLMSYMTVYMKEEQKQKDTEWRNLFQIYKTKSTKDAWESLEKEYEKLGKTEMCRQLKEKCHGKNWNEIIEDVMLAFLSLVVENEWEQVQEKYKQMRWPDTWREIIGEEHHNANISEFKKTRTTIPIVKSISQIYAIHEASKDLWKELNK